MTATRRTSSLVHICGTRTFQPGDPAPEGYVERHEWAGVQLMAGLRQRRCGRCHLWGFPQELADATPTVVCLDCAADERSQP